MAAQHKVMTPKVVTHKSDRNRLILGAGIIVGLSLLLWLFSSATDSWVNHTDASGYKISYPEQWQFTDAQNAGEPDIISSEQGTVVVNVNTVSVGDNNQSAAELISAIDGLYASVPFQDIEEFTVDVENDERASYKVAGLFTDSSGTEWRFEEKGFVSGEGIIYLARVSVISDQAGSNADTVDRILDSFEA